MLQLVRHAAACLGWPNSDSDSPATLPATPTNPGANPGSVPRRARLPQSHPSFVNCQKTLTHVYQYLHLGIYSMPPGSAERRAPRQPASSVRKRQSPLNAQFDVCAQGLRVGVRANGAEGAGCDALHIARAALHVRHHVHLDRGPSAPSGALRRSRAGEWLSIRRTTIHFFAEIRTGRERMPS